MLSIAITVGISANPKPIPKKFIKFRKVISDLQIGGEKFGEIRIVRVSKRMSEQNIHLKHLLCFLQLFLSQVHEQRDSPDTMPMVKYKWNNWSAMVAAANPAAANSPPATMLALYPNL